jgi:DNA-binding transcriptional ArsR family regulator
MFCGMNSGSDIAAIAALLGDPARANILSALMDGGERSAGDLAFVAHVTPQTASAHLAKLVDAGLLAGERRGRNRYYRLASADVARMLEEIMTVAATRPRHYRPAWMRDDALRSARTCYDHLAGRLGVAIADGLARRGHLVLATEGGEVTASGTRLLAEWGLDLASLVGTRRRFCRPCLDWSERRPHIGGTIGAALAARCFALGWIERVKDSRAVAITAAGRSGFAATFAIEPPPAGSASRAEFGASTQPHASAARGW